MHGLSEAEFLNSIRGFLGCYYLVLGVMNGVAALYLWQSGKTKNYFTTPFFQVSVSNVMTWLFASVFFVGLAPIAMSSPHVVSFPQAARDFADWLMSPSIYTLGTLAILGVMFIYRKFFANPGVAWGMFNLSLLAMGVAMTDTDFAQIVTKPDNVPIVGMLFLLGFFTWLATHRAVINDERMARGEPPLEAVESEKVLVWPDLVYTELICIIAVTAFLMIWGIALQAPLEEPASAVKTPNPSKAPWYFLGLQEMLVYYDPWMAGVVLPLMVVSGLMAIPFLDYNKAGNGYYTIEQRKFAYLTFQFGFLVLWITLIVMGTFLRGPNWNFFGPFETWDTHKVEALNNVDLSEYFWVELLGMGRPKPDPSANIFVSLGVIAFRELPGLLMLLGYFVVIPPALVLFSKSFREMFQKMGFIRYMTMTNLLLWMALLPIKMILRWTINLKYFVAVPEYLTNF